MKAILLVVALLMGATTRPATQPTTQPVIIRIKVTGYCGLDNDKGGKPCKVCCGPKARGITSTGVPASQPGCAADPKLLPYGTRIRIPGVGWRTVDDTGGQMRQDAKRGITHVDLRYNSHSQAKAHGVQWLDCEVVKPAK